MELFVRLVIIIIMYFMNNKKCIDLCNYLFLEMLSYLMRYVFFNNIILLRMTTTSLPMLIISIIIENIKQTCHSHNWLCRHLAIVYYFVGSYDCLCCSN